MIWSSHRIVTGASVFALSQNLIGSFAAVSGSTFPDALDMTFPLKHRGISHWFVIYLVPLILDYYFLMDRYLLLRFPDFIDLFSVFPLTFAIRYLIGNYLFWFFVGCLFHILEDSLTGYIPIRSPSDKVSIYHPFYTGSSKETAFVSVWGIFCLAIVFAKYWYFGTFSF